MNFKNPFIRLLTLAAAALPALVAQSYLNVSHIATTLRGINWTEEASTPVVNSGATITYYVMGRARVEGDASDYFGPGPWSAAWHNAASHPVVQRQVNTPLPTAQLAWASPVYRRASVNMAAFPKQVSSRTFSSGQATAAVNYAVRVQHFSVQPNDYFIVLNHPRSSESFRQRIHCNPAAPAVRAAPTSTSARTPPVHARPSTFWSMDSRSGLTNRLTCIRKTPRVMRGTSWKPHGDTRSTRTARQSFTLDGSAPASR